MRPLRVGVWQFAPTPGDVPDNLARLGRALGRLRRVEADLVVAPEMFLTGWHPERASWAARDGDGTLERVGALAREHGLWLAGSVHLRSGSGRSNTFVLWDARGRIAGRQDKIHLWAAERGALTPARDTHPIRTPWGSIGGMVCYDVEFPEVARRLAVQGAELLLVPAAFYSPEGWDLATRGRPLENGCFLAAANQIRGDPKHPHNGQSRIVGPRGELLASLRRTAPGTALAELDPRSIRRARSYAPLLSDRRLTFA